MDARSLALALCGGLVVGLSGCESLETPTSLRQTMRPPFLVGVPEQYEPPLMSEGNSTRPK